MESSPSTRSERYSHTERMIAVQVYPPSFRVPYVPRTLEPDLANLAIYDDRDRLEEAFTSKPAWVERWTGTRYPPDTSHPYALFAGEPMMHTWLPSEPVRLSVLLGKLLVHGVPQEGYYIWASMRRGGRTFSVRRTDDFLILNIWRTPGAADLPAGVDLTPPDITEHVHFVGFLGDMVREYLDLHQELFVNSLVMKLVEVAQRTVIGTPK